MTNNEHLPSDRRRGLRGVLGAALLSAGLLPLAAVAHAADRSVDPSSLVPPPPAFFNAECLSAGPSISCTLAFTDPVSPVNEPTGIVCGNGAQQFEVLDTWTRTVEGKRRYSSDGLLLRRHFRDRWDGTFTNSASGKSVSYSQRNTYLHDLGVPGDPGTGVQKNTVHLRVFDARGTVLMDVGRVVLSVDDDQVILRSGKSPFDDYWTGDSDALRPLCDALS